MAINVQWFDTKQEILIFQFMDTFVIDDLRTADTISKELTQDIDHSFHIIYDFLGIDNYTRFPHGLVDYLKEDRTRSPHLEQIVVLMPKSGRLLARSMIHIAKSIRRHYLQKIHIVENQAEALKLLQEFAPESKKT